MNAQSTQCIATAIIQAQQEWRNAATLASQTSQAGDLQTHLNAAHDQCLRLSRIIDTLWTAERASKAESAA